MRAAQDDPHEGRVRRIGLGSGIIPPSGVQVDYVCLKEGKDQH